MAKGKSKREDGTGPRKGSYQQKRHGIGKKRKRGQKCPKS